MGKSEKAFEYYERASRSTYSKLKEDVINIIKNGEDARDIIFDVCKYFNEDYDELIRE